MRKLLFASCLLILFAVAAPAQSTYDVILHNGRVIDGSGNPWYIADVGIRDGHIAAIGRLCPSGLASCPAKRTLDASGLVIAPGFIDVHTHVEDSIRRIPTGDNFLFDGVTSLITGNCGGSETELAKYFSELRSAGISLNLGTLIGHNSVRRAVMGSEQRDPTADEQARMEALVEQAMQEGAVGLSTGLIYIPGTYSKTPEVVGLARAAAKYNGVYASHIRNEGDDEHGGVFAAIAEAIEIGRQAKMPVEISHFKISNKKLWGQSTRTIGLVEKARADGLDVTVDQYPYTASSTNLGVLLPSWAHAGGTDERNKRLNDPTTRAKIAGGMRKSIRNRNGRKRLDYAFVASCSWDRSLEGKNLSQINKEWGRKGKLNAEIQTVLDMVEKGGAQMVYHSMDERDVVRILQFPYSMVASDGGIQQMDRGVPHPRSYGTNARVLGLYVRDKNALRLEEAIRKMTSLPAQRFRLTDRGLIRPGMWADIVVFDPAKVTDRATFTKPHAYADGFRFVLVNGEVVIADGKHTGARPGAILLGPGFRQEMARQYTFAAPRRISLDSTYRNPIYVEVMSVRPAIKRGSAELAILAVLRDRPSHGYEIAKQIALQTQGVLHFNLASLYPVLYGLEKRGWVRGSWEAAPSGRQRRYYRLTPAGKKRLAPLREEWGEFFRALHRLAGVARA